MEKRFGVYWVVNKLNGKAYIGKGVVGEDMTCSRWKDHCGRPKKPRKQWSLIQRAIARYGVDNFTFGWLEVDRSETAAFELERKWIAFWRTTEPAFGYNANWGGLGGVTCIEVSAATRAKLSASNKKREHTWGDKISAALKGRPGGTRGVPLSEEHKRNLSASQKGIPRPYLVGRPRPIEVRLRIAEAHRKDPRDGNDVY